VKHKIWQVLLILSFFLLLGGVAIAISTEQAATLNDTSADDDLRHAAPNATTAYTTVVTVTTTSDTSGDAQTTTCYYDGSIYSSASPCSFRRALIEAKALPAANRPVLIAFELAPDDPNYGLVVSGTWTMMIDAALPALTTESLLERDNGLTTIDGETQPGGRTDGPKIIFLDSDDSDITDYSLEVESGNNTIRNISWRGGGMIFLKEVSNRGGYNTVENVWIGLSDDGQEIAFRDPSNPNRLGTGGGV
jgi:hypothetical protein